MLIGFLIKDEDDWMDWKRRIRLGDGKAFIHIFDHEASFYGHGPEREEAVDEVEILDDEDEEP
jgi:cysteine protease ATG4